VEVLPPDTNRGPTFPGRQFRLGFRRPALSTCRDEVLAAITSLSGAPRKQVLDVYKRQSDTSATASHEPWPV